MSKMCVSECTISFFLVSVLVLATTAPAVARELVAARSLLADSNVMLLAGGGVGVTYNLALVAADGLYTGIATSPPSTVTITDAKNVVTSYTFTSLLPGAYGKYGPSGLGFEENDNIVLGVSPFLSGGGISMVSSDSSLWVNLRFNAYSTRITVITATDSDGSNRISHQWANVVKSVVGHGDGFAYDLSLVVSDGLFNSVDPNYASTITITGADGAHTVHTIIAVYEAQQFESNDNVVVDAYPFFSAAGVSFFDEEYTKYSLSSSGNFIVVNWLATTGSSAKYAWDFSSHGSGYVGCYADYKVDKADSLAGMGGNLDWTKFPYKYRDLPNVVVDPKNSMDNCRAKAISYGSMLFGMEEGQECWFGNSEISESYAERMNPVSEILCNVPCFGNPAEMCGGSSGALSLYKV